LDLRSIKNDGLETMKLLDYFFYVLAHNDSAMKDPVFIANPSRWISNLYHDTAGGALLALWSSMAMMTLFSMTGLIFGDYIFEFITPNTWLTSFMIGYFAPGIFIFIWYFNEKRVIRIFEWRIRMSKVKRRILYTIFLVLYWPMPIAAFVTFRLYMFGQVKWW
jgi:hypothetical protein